VKQQKQTKNTQRNKISTHTNNTTKHMPPHIHTPHIQHINKKRTHKAQTTQITTT